MNNQAKVGDLLYGAAAISSFLFGNKEDRRKVYGLADSGIIPTFKMGSVLCGRGSRIAAAIEQKERDGHSRAAPGEAEARNST
jgi:hypothetical protein